jgi:3-mercaptopropionate dioxygenase
LGEQLIQPRAFIRDMTVIVEAAEDEARLIAEGRHALASLIANDDWLPEEYAQPNLDRYQQYLIHCDPLERFSVVSFVWAPGQQTPVHDHCTWGLVGVLRGSEQSQRYEYLADAAGHRTFCAIGGLVPAKPGDVDAVSPTIGDIHRVENAGHDAVAISIHVYGGNIGTIHRHIYDESGNRRGFVSGYASTPYARIWS